MSEKTLGALRSGDIAMETLTEAEFDGPHLDGPANFGHPRPYRPRSHSQFLTKPAQFPILVYRIPKENEWYLCTYDFTADG